jgi:hypothetical protein
MNVVLKIDGLYIATGKDHGLAASNTAQSAKNEPSNTNLRTAVQSRNLSSSLNSDYVRNRSANNQNDSATVVKLNSEAKDPADASAVPSYLITKDGTVHVFDPNSDSYIPYKE